MAGIIRCNWCFWEGNETSLIPGEKECCPHCGKSGYLMDMYETNDEEETEGNEMAVERPYEAEAASVYCSIKKLAESEESLSNLESYLSMHFANWLQWANTPEHFAEELHNFATMYDE